MSELEEDIQGTGRVFDGTERYFFSKYSPVYYKTNEDLDELFKSFDFQGKKVLSVLGSGDQALYFLDHNASRVDVFDINKLSFYYYYLRIWAIKYFNAKYLINISPSIIKELLFFVRPENKQEEKAYSYWVKYIELYSNRCIDFFFYDSCVVSNRRYDINYLKYRMMGLDFNYYNVDVSKVKDIGEKYDVIYTSNISEYFLTSEEIDKYRESMCNSLGDGGIVISSNVAQRFPTLKEKLVMSKSFKYHDLSFVDIINPNSKGYYYTKRR